MPLSKLSRKKADKKDAKQPIAKDDVDTTETDEVKKETEEETAKTESDAPKQDCETKQGRLFHDDTFKGFSRRLAWSNDGELVVVPSGVVEIDGEAKVTHCTYVFTRLDLTKPAVCLPTLEKYTIAAKFCPLLYKLRPIKRKNVGKDDNLAPWEKFQTLFSLPYRMVYAVATQNAVMIYDTQQSTPISRVSNIHYTGLTDLSWSPDGRILFVSSTDGFCSIITFPPGELGEVYTSEEVSTQEPVPNPQVDSAVLEQKDGDVEEPGKKTVSIADDVEDKLQEVGFNEHGVKSPAQVKIKSNKEGGKSNAKRLKFITLKSPKAKLPHPVNSEVHNENGVDGEDFEDGIMDGVVPMDEDTLDLQLEETQTADAVTENKSESSTVDQKLSSEPVVEKKRVPLISVPNGATPPLSSAADPSSDDKQAAPGSVTDKPVQKKRVELITLSSNPVKPLSQ